MPSRTGMCDVRSCFCACSLWQVAQSSISFAFTQLGLLRLRRVHRVARHAGQIAGGVSAAVPHRVLGLVVARHAGLVGLARRHLGELQDVPLGIVVDVRLAGTVARLAALVGGGRARNLRVPVSGAVKIGSVVAGETRVLPDVAPLLRLRRGRGRLPASGHAARVDDDHAERDDRRGQRPRDPVCSVRCVDSHEAPWCADNYTTERLEHEVSAVGEHWSGRRGHPESAARCARAARGL